MIEITPGYILLSEARSPKEARLPPNDWQDLSRSIEDDPAPSAKETSASPSETEDNASSSDPNKPKGNRRIRDMRRSERVAVEMLVDVCVCSDEEDDPDPVFTRGKTLDVSAHGALLDVAMPVDIGQTLRMINVRTKREIECHVLRFAKRYPDGGGHIGVEFAGVSRHFWEFRLRHRIGTRTGFHQGR